MGGEGLDIAGGLLIGITGRREWEEDLFEVGGTWRQPLDNSRFTTENGPTVSMLL